MVDLRLALPQDLEQIALLLPDLAGPLFSERFPQSTIAGFCTWKYHSNPLGDAAVGIAVADGHVVSLAAAVPKLIQVGLRRLLAFELGDFITAPEYRKRGLFSSLVQMICDEAKRRGAALVYVSPNSNSFRTLKSQLCFREVQKVDNRHFVKPSALIERRAGIPASISRRLGVDRIARAALFPSGSREVRVEPVAEFGPEVDHWWAATAPRFSFALVRNHVYLNWRYVHCPAPYQSFVARRNGHFAGYLTSFVLQTQPIGYILDLVTDPADRKAAGELLCCGLNAMLAQGATTIFTWTLHSGARSAGTDLLKTACLLPSGPPSRVAVRFLQGREEKAGLPDDGWQLNLGDFDGI